MKRQNKEKGGKFEKPIYDIKIVLQKFFVAP